MEKHLIVFDTISGKVLLDGNPIKTAEKIEIRATALETQVTLTISNCDVQVKTRVAENQLIFEEI